MNRIKRSQFFSLCVFLVFPACTLTREQSQSMSEVISRALEHATEQSLLLAAKVSEHPQMLPKTVGKCGKLEMSSSDWWCSGFFPGTLWYLYEQSKNDKVKKYAIEFTERLTKEQYNTTTHDLGFMLYCSFGNAFRLTQNPSYKAVLIQGAESLISRYDPKVGCIRSWDFNSEQWRYPVIIDNMMNLELLMWAYDVTNREKFKAVCENHADKTLENQFRPDYSCYHVVSYAPETGVVEWKGTHQGLNDESAWARGQAWALYGYTMMYRETKMKKYLIHAENVANFILNHPNLPDDKIPYWDFDDPEIPNSLRDASAGAVIASALIELSQYVEPEKSNLYLSVAETQLRTLSSSEYTASIGTNEGFILKHSVGYLLAGSEVDVPLTYADYYYVEALLRYKHYVLKLS